VTRLSPMPCEAPVTMATRCALLIFRSFLVRTHAFGSRVAHPRNADRKSRGSAMGLRWTRNPTSRLTVVSAVLLVMRKTGLGEKGRFPGNPKRGTGRHRVSTMAFL